MTNSLLSWDDLEEDENPNVAAAAKAVKEIDASEVLSEVAKQEQVLLEQKQNATNPVGVGSFNYTPDLKIPADREIVIQPRAPHLNIPSASILERAVLAISNMDGQLPHGGRLKSEDKRLLNSATDLNQLVPFKYDWAWKGYLESCNGHWMPTEVSLDKDYAELNAKKLVGEKEVYQIPSNQRKVICDLLVNHIYLRQAAPNIVWLNLYRMLENPEGRQYLLRQIFEETLADHAMMYIQDTTEIMLNKIDGVSVVRLLELLEGSYKDRHRIFRAFLPMFTEEKGTTLGKDNLREFMIELVLLYIFVNWISPFRGIYHVLKLNRQQSIVHGIAKLSDLMLRDLVHHQQVFKLILETAMVENPEVFDLDFKDELKIRVKKFLTVEEDLYSVFSVDENDYGDLSWFARVELNRIYNILDMSDSLYSVGNVPSAFIDSIMTRLKNHEIELHGGGMTVTGQGGGLGWD